MTHIHDAVSAYAPEDDLIERAIEALDRRLRSRRDPDEATITCPKDAARMARLQLSGRSQELFWGAFLDQRHRLLSSEILFYGTIDGASVYPREIIKRALRLNAAAIIVAHNHPSGLTDPSHSDRGLTKRIQEACELFDIRLLDHFVVGEGEPYSFAENRLL